jgi:RNA polymerase sigma factor (TIGR02999 family)
MLSASEDPAASENDAGGEISDQRQLLDELFTRLYDRIRRLAARVRWSGTNPTLSPTALAHEAYLKLRKDPPDLGARSYDDVIAIFANAMHQILIDAARRKGAQKRVIASPPDNPDLPIEDALTIAAAIEGLERENPAQARIVQCRFLLGMTVDETAAALGFSKRSVEREWHEARLRLTSKIDPGQELR